MRRNHGVPVILPPMLEVDQLAQMQPEDRPGFPPAPTNRWVYKEEELSGGAKFDSDAKSIAASAILGSYVHSPVCVCVFDASTCV